MPKIQLIKAAVPSSTRFIHQTERRCRRPAVGRGEAVTDQEEIERGQHEQHQRIARQPIPEATPARRFEVLLHGHGPDIPDTALVEMPRGAVMDRMLPTPMLVGGERQRAGDEADDVVGAARAEIRAMAAVMKDDEQAHQERARQHCRRDREPERDFHAW